jgi:hypothetical protein
MKEAYKEASVYLNIILTGLTVGVILLLAVVFSEMNLYKDECIRLNERCKYQQQLIERLEAAND